MTSYRESYWMSDAARHAAREIIDGKKEIASLLGEIKDDEQKILGFRQKLEMATANAARQDGQRRLNEEVATIEAEEDEKVLTRFRFVKEAALKYAADAAALGWMPQEQDGTTAETARQFLLRIFRKPYGAELDDDRALALYRLNINDDIRATDAHINQSRMRIAALEQDAVIARNTIERERFWFVRSGVQALGIAVTLSVIGNALWYGHGYLHEAVMPSPMEAGATVLAAAMTLWGCIIISGLLVHINERIDEAFHAQQVLIRGSPATASWLDREAKKPSRERPGALILFSATLGLLFANLLLAPLLFFSSIPVLLLQHYRILPAYPTSFSFAIWALLIVWGITSVLLLWMHQSNAVLKEERGELIVAAIGMPPSLFCFVGLLCAFFVPSPFDRAYEAVALIAPQWMKSAWTWTLLAGLGWWILFVVYYVLSGRFFRESEGWAKFCFILSETWAWLIGRDAVPLARFASSGWRTGADVVSWRELVPLETEGRRRDRFEHTQ